MDSWQFGVYCKQARRQVQCERNIKALRQLRPPRPCRRAVVTSPARAECRGEEISANQGVFDIGKGGTIRIIFRSWEKIFLRTAAGGFFLWPDRVRAALHGEIKGVCPRER